MCIRDREGLTCRSDWSTDFTLDGSNNVGSHKDVPIRVLLILHTIQKVESSKKATDGDVFTQILRQILKLSCYQNYCINRNQILHNDRDHQVLFMCGPNMPSKNQDGDRLPFNNKKITISNKRQNWVCCFPTVTAIKVWKLAIK